MSHNICNRCGARFRDEHDCPQNFERLLQDLRDTQAQVSALEEKNEALLAALKQFTEKAQRGWRLESCANTLSRELGFE